MIHVVITRACNYNIMIASPSAAQVDAYVSCPLSSILLPNTYIEILKRAWTFLLPTDRLRQTCFTRLRPANDDLLHPFACTERPRTAHAETGTVMGACFASDRPRPKPHTNCLVEVASWPSGASVEDLNQLFFSPWRHTHTTHTRGILIIIVVMAVHECYNAGVGAGLVEIVRASALLA